MGRVAIVDYGLGNLHSVENAVWAVGGDPVVASSAEELEAADRVILPGVGAFREGMRNLRASGLLGVLDDLALRRRVPVLGICLGMQLMARRGSEDGEEDGLGWMDAEVAPLPRDGVKVPHVGWTDTRPVPGCPLFEGLRNDPPFYYVHSYAVRPQDPRLTVATAVHGEPFTAAVLRDNLAGVQFHPEKSQEAGLKVLENFLGWRPDA